MSSLASSSARIYMRVLSHIARHACLVMILFAAQQDGLPGCPGSVWNVLGQCQTALRNEMPATYGMIHSTRVSKELSQRPAFAHRRGVFP